MERPDEKGVEVARARLTRMVRFGAEHRYWREEWTAEENRARFGSWADPEPHAHEFRCEVTVEGAVDPATGMIVDLSRLDDALEREVAGRFRGRALHALDDFSGERAVPSTENLARVVWDRVSAALPDLDVVRVRVAEDDRLWSDYLGE